MRTAKGISQTQLASRIDPTDSRMTQTYISKVENGRKNITILTLAVIADALGVELDELVRKNEREK